MSDPDSSTARALISRPHLEAHHPSPTAAATQTLTIATAAPPPPPTAAVGPLAGVARHRRRHVSRGSHRFWKKFVRFFRKPRCVFLFFRSILFIYSGLVYLADVRPYFRFSERFSSLAAASERSFVSRSSVFSFSRIFRDYSRLRFLIRFSF